MMVPGREGTSTAMAPPKRLRQDAGGSRTVVPGRHRPSIAAAAAAAEAGCREVAVTPATHKVPWRLLRRVASVACGVQFGWGLQLSLLTLYVQELGIPHQWASLVWLCGPLSGLIVQPLVGHLSDRRHRRPPCSSSGIPATVPTGEPGTGRSPFTC